MSKWTDLSMRDVAVAKGLVGGPFGSKLVSRDYVDSGVPVIRGQNLGANRFVSFTDCVFVTREKVERDLRGNLAEPGDLVFTQRGTLGQVAIMPETAPSSVISQSQMRLRVDPAKADPRFVYYWSASPGFRQAISDHAIVAGVPHINLGILGALPLSLPPLSTQRTIASALGTIDDLIENNRRRVEVLEEIARAIYREWFVNFRYPGHEDVPLVDSALGPIPEGWKASTCGDELTFIGGGTPSKKEPGYWDGGTVAWYTPSDLTKTGWRYAADPELRITEQGVAKSSARVFPAGSVMMTSRATLGVLAVATTEATTNQGFIVILPDQRWTSGFVHEWLDANADALAALGTGATFKEITKGRFKSFPFLVPAQRVLDAYREVTEPIESQVRLLEQQTRGLTRLRDLLLPKLVTGQIDVSALDLDVLVSTGSTHEGAVA